MTLTCLQGTSSQGSRSEGECHLDNYDTRNPNPPTPPTRPGTLLDLILEAWSVVSSIAVADSKTMGLHLGTPYTARTRPHSMEIGRVRSRPGQPEVRFFPRAVARTLPESEKACLPEECELNVITRVKVGMTTGAIVCPTRVFLFRVGVEMHDVILRLR